MSFIPTEYSDPIFVYSLRNVFPRYGGPLVRVIRESDHIEGDVYPDDNGEVSYDSTIIVNPSETSALVLGEFLNIDGYTDADGLGEVYEGRLSKIYDQSSGSFDVGVNIYNVSFLFVETNLPAYGGSTAIHKVNGVPAFFATATQPMFKLAQARGREVSYHFMTEGVGATQYFGFIDWATSYRIWGLHDIEAEITSATLFPTQQWDINAIYFDSELGDNSFVSNVYSSETFNNFDSVITTVEAQLLDTATTQTAFPDNEVTFNVMSNNWYCDIVAFDGYDPIRRITIEQLYAQSASNTTAFARTSSLLIDNENPNQSGFLAQFPNAAAAYSVRSLTGNTGTDGPKVVRVRRDSDNVEVDVYTDATGFITLDSPISAVPAITGGIDGGTGAELETLAETLGEFVFATDYNNPDGLASADTAKVVVWYDQSDTNYSNSNLPAEVEERGAPVRIRVVGGRYDNHEFDLYFDENDTISLSSYIADTIEITDSNGQVTANISQGTLQTLLDTNEETIYNTLPGDISGVTYNGLFSMHIIKTGYTGPCLQVSANATVTGGETLTDIGFVDGFVDVESLETLAAGGDLFVQKWYNQDGSGNDFNRNTTHRPYIAIDGEVTRDPYGRVGINIVRGQAGGTFAGTLKVVHGVTGTDLSTFQSHYKGVHVNNNWTDGNDNTSAIPNNWSTRSFAHNGSVNAVGYDDAGVQWNFSASNADNTGNFIYGFGTTATETSVYRYKDDSQVDFSAPRTLNYNYIVIGGRQNSDNASTMYFHEYIIVDGNVLASHGKDICDNMNQRIKSYGWEGRVVAWYDQSGNANDATQTTTSRQPKVYDSATGVVLENNKPAISNWLSTQTILISNFGATYNDVHAFSVSKENQGSSIGYIVSGDTTTGFRVARNGQGADVWLYDGLSSKTTTAESNVQAIVSAVNGINPVVHFNGSARSMDNTLVGRGMSGAYIGNHPTLSSLGNFDGTLQELIIYPSDQNAAGNRTGIEATINNYYDIYGTGNTGANEKLLDTYTGAAAAYSLRKLRTAYSGPVNLSNRKDAKQQVAGNQPTLVSSGELVKENGKVALSFTTLNKMSVSTPSVFDDTNEFSAFSLISPKLDEFTLGFFWGLTDNNGGDIVLVYSTSELLTFAAYTPLAGPRINNVSISSNQYLVHTESGQNARLDVNLEDNSGTVDINNFSKAVLLEINNKENLEASCNYQELVFYTSSQQNERPNIESNINSAFQIYSAAFPSALDTVPEAKAAYSVRRLTKEYTGPIITVNNGTTEKDFYADFWGNLDKTALTEFKGAGTLSITKWWDQSGREEHLVATGGSKPILDPATLNITVNDTNKFNDDPIITDINSSYDPDNEIYLLDEYSGAAAAYSLRKIRSGYDGPLVRVRRDGTNTEVDVFPDSNGELSLDSLVEDVVETSVDENGVLVNVDPDTTTATNLGEFVADAGYTDADSLGGPVSAFVVVWHDQANSNNVTQAVADNQPKVYDSATGVVLENGKPVILSESGGQHLLNSNFSQTTIESFSVAKVSSSFIYSAGFSGSGGAYAIIAQKSSTGTTINSNSGTVAYRLNSASWTPANRGDVYTALEDTQKLLGISFDATSWPELYIGYTGNVALAMFSFQEVIFYPSDQSANRTDIEREINRHYQIYDQTNRVVAVHNGDVQRTVDLNQESYTDLKEIIHYQ